MASGKFQILQGDALDTVKKLCRKPEERNRYRLIVTSPPYYKHRNYGEKKEELGQEKSDSEYIDSLANIFAACREMLTDDGSLFIVIGDTRRNHAKLMIPHRLAARLIDMGYVFQEDIIWYKRNAVSTSSKTSLAQSYEFVLFLSKNKNPHLNMDSIRVQGNEVTSGMKRGKVPAADEIQSKPMKRDKKRIREITETIHNSSPETPHEDLPSTSEISWAYGYDPEKHCPTCYRKFKRHATRKRFGGHRHYPIFAVCNPGGKNPGNVWDISTKAHHGNEHFAMFPEDLIARIVKFATEEGDHVMDPFVGRGTSGIVSACLKRRFTGIDLYPDCVAKTKRNTRDAANMKLPEKIIRQIITAGSDIREFL